MQTNLYEYSVDSQDREERIQARRQRVQKLLTAQEGDKKESQKELDDGSKEEAAQIRKSTEELAKRRREVHDDVTLIQLQAERAEQARLATDSEKRKQLRDAAVTEKAASAKENQVIAEEWTKLAVIRVAETLQQSIDEQKKRCDQVLSSKDKIIKDYRQALKDSSEDFKKALVAQGEDIDKFIDLMKKYFREMNTKYEEQLAHIEATFESTRKKLRDENEAEIERLYTQRRLLEEKFMEAKAEKQVQDESILEQVHQQDADECAFLKTQLETEIQVLQQSLQQMRAIYLMNTEKLEYDLSLLSQRETVHSERISAGKAKINRLQDTLAQLRAKYAKYEKQFRQRNSELTEEYKRMIEQYQDLQTTFSRFRKADLKKYRDVWTMNQERASGIVGKILTADKVIHEQLLGLLWYPPSEDIFKLDIETLLEEKERCTLVSGSSKSTARTDNIDPAAKSLLASISDDAGFLVDHKVQEVLATAEASEKKTLVVEALLNTLHVDTRDDINKLLYYLAKQIYPNSADINQEELRKMTLNPTQVVAAIKGFVDDHERAKNEEQKELEAKARATQELKEFWTRISQVIGEDTGNMWESLQNELAKYHGIFKRRVDLLEANRNLREQNAELKRLLQEYVSAKVNEELVCPPIQYSTPADAPAQQST